MTAVIHLNMIKFGEMQQALENMRWLMGSKADASKLNCVFTTWDLIRWLWSWKIPSALDSCPTGSSITAAPDNCCNKFWNVIKEPVREGARKDANTQGSAVYEENDNDCQIQTSLSWIISNIDTNNHMKCQTSAAVHIPAFHTKVNLILTLIQIKSYSR